MNRFNGDQDRFVDIRSPDGKLLFRYNPVHGVIEIKHKGHMYTVSLYVQNGRVVQVRRLVKPGGGV